MCDASATHGHPMLTWSRFWLAVAVLCVSAGAAVAQGNITQREVKAAAGKEVRVAVYGDIRPDCTSGPLPAIRLVTAPAHGAVNVKRGTLKSALFRKLLVLEPASGNPRCEATGPPTAASYRPTTNNASRPRCRFTSPSIAPREISAVPMNSCWKSVSRAVSSSSASASMSPARRAAARTSRARRANQCGFASAAPPRMPSLHRLNAQGDEPGTARQDRRAYRIRTKIEKLARARYAGFMRR